MRWLYTLFFHLLLPFILLRMLWKSIWEPSYRIRWYERLGWYSKHQPAHDVIWFHAVSVGEAEAAFPLIREMQCRYPNYSILVTCTTPTGSSRIQSVLGASVSHVYLPYDYPIGINRFLREFNPVLGVILETEIWPNLYHACGVHGIPLALVNARLSAKSSKGYGKIKGLVSETLAHVNLIAAQTIVDAERFTDIGALTDSIKVTGNIKYDLELPENYIQLTEQLKTQLFKNQLVWIAGSTHEGEEAGILKVFATLKREFDSLVLVLVPRHPPRFDKVARLCVGAGFSLARRSSWEGSEKFDVFLVDTLGELRLFYGASDIAFVGGSLVNIGGHNVLEAAIAAKPVIIGPYTYHFSEMTEGILASGGAIRINDFAELEHRMTSLCRDADLRVAIGESASAFAESGRGAVKRVAGELAHLIPAS